MNGGREAAVKSVLADDAEDPAIWLHPDDVSKRLVLATCKEARVNVIDLQPIHHGFVSRVRYNPRRYNYNRRLRATLRLS
ncbi:MAG: phytase [Gammaproteobacteria bacterium]